MFSYICINDVVNAWLLIFGAELYLGDGVFTGEVLPKFRQKISEFIWKIRTSIG